MQILLRNCLKIKNDLKIFLCLLVYILCKNDLIIYIFVIKRLYF